MASITPQVFFVILTGLLLPPAYAISAQAIYVLIGLIGIPVFTEGGGLAYALKPTFGFLLGFILAAWVIALILKNTRLKESFWGVMFVSVIGIIVIYLIGVPYGYIIFNRVMGLGWSLKQVIITFCAIYLPLDILKAVLASLIGFAVNRRLKRLT